MSMSTQNERQAVMAVIETCRDQLCDIDDATDEVIDIVRAPLLSRIEWLEAEKHSWKTYAKGLYSRIDALSKDADPVAWISTVQCIGPDYGKELYGKLPVQSLQAGYYKHTPLYLGKQSSIDAAISAREGE